MTTFLALARLTVGADDKTHLRELKEGLERVVEEMKAKGMTDADIERAWEDACALNEVDL